jgi:hypothetical protein
MKRKTIDLDKLRRKGLALVAIPVMLLGLTGCNKGNPNTKEEVISEETSEIPYINATETTVTTVATTDPTETVQTTISTQATTSTKETSTTVTTEATTSTTEKSNEFEYKYNLITDEVYETIISNNINMKSFSDLFVTFTKGYTPEQTKEICNIVFAKATFDGSYGASISNAVRAAYIINNCISPEFAEEVKSSLLNSNIDKLDELNLSAEEKEYYIYMHNLYLAYLDAVNAKDTYLMTINGAKIYDAIYNIDELLLKNKITSDERLNYYVSYKDGEFKESNLMLGDSYLKNYFELMKYYVCEENYIEFCNWDSTKYAIENTFGMLEEEFIVEKFDDKYVAISVDEKQNQKVVK